MDVNRIYRLTIPGIMFLFSFISFSLFFRSSLIDKLNKLNLHDTANLLILILTTPIIGFMISTIGIAILFSIFGYRLFYKLPEDRFVNIFDKALDIKVVGDKETGNSKDIELRNSLLKYYSDTNWLERILYC